MSTMRDMLERHTALFNQGVRSGDFAPMLEHFSDDAEFAIRGLPVGPFIGKAAIAAAYANQPPSDEIVVLSVHEEADRFRAVYAWRQAPLVRAGEMILVPRGDLIRHLIVAYGNGE